MHWDRSEVIDRSVGVLFFTFTVMVIEQSGAIRITSGVDDAETILSPHANAKKSHHTTLH